MKLLCLPGMMSFTVGPLALFALMLVPSAADESKPSKINLAWVPDHTRGLVFVRASQLSANEHLKPILPVVETLLTEPLGVKFQDLEQIVAFEHPSSGPPNTWSRHMRNWTYVAIAKQSIEFAYKLSNQQAEPSKKIGEFELLAIPALNAACCQVDDKTIIVGNPTSVAACLDVGPEGKPHFSPLAEAKLLAGSNIVVSGDPVFMFSPFIPMPDEATIRMYHPLFRNTRNVIVGLRLDHRLAIAGYAECELEEQSQSFAKTLEALLTIQKNMMEAPLPKSNPWTEIYRTLLPLVASAKVDYPSQKMIRLRASHPDLRTVGNLFVNFVSKARSSASENASANNLKMLALAMHNHHDVFRKFPPAAGSSQPEGPPISWRVRLLPYLGEAALYKQYRQDEPWDSEANLEVLKKMPSPYRHPSDDPKSTDTSYFVLTGEKTIFGKLGGANFKDVVDGSSKTFLIVEARRPVPWTKPEDIEVLPDQPFPKLGGFNPASYKVALADGAVFTVSVDADEKVLHAFATRSGRELVTTDELIKK